MVRLTVKQASFTLSSKLEKVKEILNWVHSQMDVDKVSPQEVRKIELAMEEAVVNVLEHSYEGKGGDLDITVHDEKPGELVFVLKDLGPPFDPLAYTEMIQSENLVGAEERGGLGVLLMCRAMDHVHYQREGAQNVLTLTKKLSKFR